MPCNQAAFIRKVQLLTNHLVDYITTRLNNSTTKFAISMNSYDFDYTTYITILIWLMLHYIVLELQLDAIPC